MDKEKTSSHQLEQRHFLRGWCEAKRHFTLLLQHLVGIRDLGLIRQRHRPAVDQLQNLLFNRLWWAWAQVLTPNNHMSDTQHTHRKKTPVLHQQTPWKATRTSYLGRNHFDELIEEAELAHFAVKPLATVFHTRFQNLEGEKLPKTQVNPAKFQNIHWQFQLFWTVHFWKKSKSVPSLKSTLESLLSLLCDSSEPISSRAYRVYTPSKTSLYSQFNLCAASSHPKHKDKKPPSLLTQELTFSEPVRNKPEFSSSSSWNASPLEQNVRFLCHRVRMQDV